jgi:CPA2 family monovalent cation:H+ antiporter-2
MGLAQIGEFSFIIASLGVTLNVTSRFLYPIAVAVSAITTLLTPYLLKNTDRVVNWFDRVAPQGFLDYLNVYTRWVGRLADQKTASMAATFARRWLWQSALNAALVGAVFVAAAFLGRRPPGWLHKLGMNETMLKSALWLSAMIVCLPLLVATFRKLQALGMLIAETKISEAAASERAAAVRAIVSKAIPLTGMALLGLYVLLLGSALLPSWKGLLVLLAVVASITWLFWRSFIRVYSKAQVALHETLTTAPESRHDHTPAPLRSLLRDAHLETIRVTTDSVAAGKLIRELELRTRTGASIVAIERDGASIVNPGPDEELKSADKVLVLGTRNQLDAAKALLDREGLA